MANRIVSLQGKVYIDKNKVNDQSGVKCGVVRVRKQIREAEDVVNVQE